MKEEQNVVRSQTSSGKHFEREEIGFGQDCHMRSDEVLPVCFWLRCGADARP
jgi:hypothetical protein